ncbi:MAG: phage tail assembly chaperone [Ardenticatenales bacterium]|nr:phage tail assembly chaperone [Ardenticatenales bacterium]
MTWLGLWSGARYDLGLSDEEFWSLTLRELMALFDRHAAAEERANVRATAATAEVWALLANVYRKTGQPARYAHHLFPFLRREPRQQTQAEALNELERTLAMWPGEGEVA